MKVRILFMLAHVFFVWTSSDNNTLIPSDLSGLADMIQKICPGANICSEYRTYEAPQSTFPPGFESCCIDCSCGPNCEVDGNCCFPDTKQTRRKLDDKTLQPETVCLFPSTVPPAEKNLVRYYKMISYIPKRFEDKINSATNLSCGEAKVAPWGSLYPVYSAERKSIYKNIACAKVDDVKDGILWNARLHCLNTIDNDIFVDVTSFVIGLNSGFVHEHCSVYFIYPGDNQDIQSLICYDDLRYSCETDNFDIPDYVNVSRLEVKEACKSGLVSPYSHVEMFANVFCFICTNDTFLPYCLKRDDGSSRDESLRGFISLIDSDFISDTRRNYTTNHKENPQACTVQPASNSQEIRDCRRVFCPSGQLRDSNGRCKYPNSLWLGQEYKLPIELTAEESIDIGQVFQVEPGKVTSTLPNITRPWQDNWQIDRIFYEDIDDNKNVTIFRVILSNCMTEVRPDQLFRNIKKRINRNWTLRHNNVTTILKSKITKYKSLSQARGSTIIIGNHSESISQPLFTKIFSQPGRPQDEFVISKLYWCDQVELALSEFILSLDKTVLFNKITIRYMYNGEFVLIKVNSDEDVTARICIEDSGMHRIEKVSSSNGSMSYKICSVWFSILTLFFP